MSLRLQRRRAEFTIIIGGSFEPALWLRPRLFTALPLIVAERSARGDGAARHAPLSSRRCGATASMHVAAPESVEDEKPFKAPSRAI